MSNNYITQFHREFELVGVSGSWSSSCSSRQWEPAPSRGLRPQDPRLSSPAEWEKKCCYSQYVAVCSVSNSLLSQTTLSQPFRIKCERYIFLKKCVRSSLLLILIPHVYVYSCICITAIQHRLSHWFYEEKLWSPFLCDSLHYCSEKWPQHHQINFRSMERENNLGYQCVHVHWLLLYLVI